MHNRIFIDDCQHWLESTDYPLSCGYDLIYIDPPYDTGTKFSYNDSRADWTEWMRPKLEQARDKLREDGAIFISIDDNRLIDLCNECDMIFDKKNRIAIMITHQSQRSNSKHINIVHEYIIAYAKCKKKLPGFEIPRIYTSDGSKIKKIEKTISKIFVENGQEKAQDALRQLIVQYRKSGMTWISNYRSVDDNGRIFYPKDLSVPGLPNTIDIPCIGLHLDPLPTRRWSSEKKFIELSRKHKIAFIGDRPYEKHYLSEATDSVSSILPFYSRRGTADLRKIGCGGLFDTPKPVAMIEMLILMMSAGREEIHVLDFFGGSGTTGQAAFQAQMKLENSCAISFDLIQTREPIREGTIPYKRSIELGIEPDIASLMKYRIDSYLKYSKIEYGYELYEIEGRKECQ